MREVSALREIHAEERVARLEKGEEHRGIGRRTAVRLHVGVLGPEQLLESVDRQLFDLVHDVAATVVALTRQSFGVLVGERRADRFHDRRRHEILAGDELEPIALPLRFFVDQVRDYRIRLRQGIPRRQAIPLRPIRAGCTTHVVFPEASASLSSRSIFATRP